MPILTKKVPNHPGKPPLPPFGQCPNPRHSNLKGASLRPYFTFSGIPIPYHIFVTGTTGGAYGERICHVEKFLFLTDCLVGKFSTWHFVMCRNLSTWQMWRKSVLWRKLSTWEMWRQLSFAIIRAVLLQDLFCCNLCWFVVKCVWSRFTHFCLEKNWTKNCVCATDCGEKRTNIRYDVEYQTVRSKEQIWYWDEGPVKQMPFGICFAYMSC